MSEIWRNILRLPQISATDNFFFDLGGHSLLAAIVVSKLRGHPEFINLSMPDFYANPTIQKLSLLAARAESTNETSKVELPKDAMSGRRFPERLLVSSPWRCMCFLACLV